MDEPTPERLLKVINKSDSFKDSKEMILFLHLYIEHYINEMICHYANEELHETIKESLTFDTKIKFLKKVNVIPEQDICKVLKSINQIRNFLSHRLLLTTEMVQDKLDTLTFSFKMPYTLEDSNIIDLGKEYKKNGFNKFDKFRASSHLLIGILYIRFKKLKGEQIDQFFYPKFEKHNGKETCWVLLYKRTKEKKP